MAETIRRATHEDIDDVARLNAEVQALHASHDPELFKTAADHSGVAEFFAEIIDKADHELGILGTRGAVAGYIWVEHQQKPESVFTHPVSRLYIHHIAVSSAARRHGAGSRLMRWAEERAEMLGATSVALTCMPANEAARRFYERLGFVTERVILRKPV